MQTVGLHFFCFQVFCRHAQTCDCFSAGRQPEEVCTTKWAPESYPPFASFRLVYFHLPLRILSRPSDMLIRKMVCPWCFLCADTGPPLTPWWVGLCCSSMGSSALLEAHWSLRRKETLFFLFSCDPGSTFTAIFLNMLWSFLQPSLRLPNSNLAEENLKWEGKS